ncbi:MAG: DUF4065 domain-containing protein [Tannerellaceae bacterium]|jgi:uncharacterized phage-associated protein|nr:DUF4065 domain-containing protein [Tannerellaceae bacterium]
MNYKVLDIANKIIKMASDHDAGELISNMKLQKLLYYQQGFHLAYFGKPLFEENIEAWMYGPVVPSIYEKYKTEGSNGLKYEGSVISLTPKEEALFNEVMRVYGEFSAIGLMNLTHSENPWKETSIGVGNEISKDKMMCFFKKKLK